MNECQYGCMVSLPSFCSRPNAWARALIYYHVCVPAWVCVGFLCIALPFLSINLKTTPKPNSNSSPSRKLRRTDNYYAASNRSVLRTAWSIRYAKKESNLLPGLTKWSKAHGDPQSPSPAQKKLIIYRAQIQTELNVGCRVLLLLYSLFSISQSLGKCEFYGFRIL